MFSAIRRLTKNAQPTIVLIRDKEGKPITSIEGQIHRWKEYMEEILNSSSARNEGEELVNIPTELPLSVRPPLKRNC